MREVWARVWRNYGPRMIRPAPALQARAALGAALGLSGIALIGWVGGLWGGWPGPVLIAPMGASAVLVFAVPDSPLAQPWPVLVGNSVSAVVALVLLMILPATPFNPALAVGLAILAMMQTRSLHPPGGAVALTIALAVGAQGVRAGVWLLPVVVLDSLWLVATGLMWRKS